MHACTHTHTHTDEILQKIHEAGFEIALQKELTLTKEQAAEFYKEHKDKEYFDSLCAHMSRYTDHLEADP